ncbi:MAG: hypothetical protein AAGK22_06100 [Acidobacteriota bacterium]
MFFVSRLFALLGLMPFVAVSEGPPLGEVPILPLACEVSIALSAAPESLQEEAGVFAFTEQGYELVREAENPFTCVVNRDHPAVLKPTCFDREGTRTVIPKIRYVGDQLLAGVETEALRRDLAAKFENGVFESQGRAGVAYMLSRYNRPVNPQTGELGFFPPHVMFYAPNLTNEDIGHDMAHHDMSRPLPMIAYGGPQGYMIMISDDGTERSRADLDASCPDWVFDPDWVYGAEGAAPSSSATTRESAHRQP